MNASSRLVAARPGARARLRPAGYWLVFTVPALLPLSWWLIQATGSFLWAALPIAWLYGLLPLTDWLIGRDRAAPIDAQDTWLSRRLVPWLCLPVQLAVVFGSLAVLPSMPWWAAVMWVLSLGYSAMLPIAFIPPLFRKLIHPRLDAVQAPAAEK